MKTKTKVKKESPFAKMKRENAELLSANQRHRARVDELEKMLVKASSEANQWERSYRIIKASIGRLMWAQAGVVSKEVSDKVAPAALHEIWREPGDLDFWGGVSGNYAEFPLKDK